MKKLIAWTFVLTTVVLIAWILFFEGALVTHQHFSSFQDPSKVATAAYVGVFSRHEKASTLKQPLGNKSYVVVLKYGGQQGSGMRSLSVLQCTLGSFYDNFYIVEPFLGESNIGPHNNESGEGVNFSMLFDFDSFNAESRQMGYPEMVTLDEYLHNAPKNVIYVHVRLRSSTRNWVVWSAERDGERVKCYDEEVDGQLMKPRYNKVIMRTRTRFSQVLPNYCVVRIVKLHIFFKNDMNNTTKFCESSKIRELVFNSWSPNEVSLVFTYYYNKLYLPVLQPLHGIDCLEKYAQYEIREQFKPSARLLSDAKEYEKRFLGRRNRLAIMFRLERILKYYVKEDDDGTRPRSLEGCFKEATGIFKGMHRGDNKLAPMLTLDIGKFGTNSLNYNRYENVTELSERMLTAVYGHQWSLNDWEESFAQVTSGETSGPYIAALQRILASRADCMILVGGGSFQAMAVQDYMVDHQNSEKCIHLVCVMTERNLEVQKTISGFESLYGNQKLGH